MAISAPALISTSVRCPDDAAALFAHVGAATADDTLLLESADVTTKSGVHSLAVLRSSLRVTCRGRRVEVTPLTPSGEVVAADLAQTLAAYRAGAHTYDFPPAASLEERDRLTDASTMDVLRALTTGAGYQGPDGVLPLVGGGIAFDYLETFEDLPPVEVGRDTYPDYQFLLAEIVLSVDHAAGTARLDAVDAVAGGSGVAERVAELVAAIESYAASPQPTPAEPEAEGGDLVATTDLPDAVFRREIERLQERIAAGDVYQVVPARAFHVPCPDAYAAYRCLKRMNPSPSMFYARGIGTDGRPYELFGASPESNLTYAVADGSVELCPIAGTRPRGLRPDGGVDHELDTRLELELRTDAKEIAEHTMLLDLARNDLARVAEPGTRQVAELFAVHRYSRVMHLVSRVTARLRSDLDALDAFRACMTMGTLTGAPKLKAVELLRGVEGRRRGSYGGAVGYLRGTGDMDTCIVIRSAFVSGGVASVQAGAGVVRDSSPQAEADETLHKAYATLSAIAAAQGATLAVVR